MHARRVKELFLPAKYGFTVPIMMSMLDTLGRLSLLPNLHTLSIGAHAVTLNELDCFFLCLNLRQLQIQGKGINFLLPRVVQAAPSIQVLEVLDESIPLHLLPLLKHLHQLRYLKTGNEFIISPASFTSSFPFSEHLTTWHASSIGFCNDDTILPQGIEFPSLTTLELTEPIPADELANLFSQSFFPKLQHLTFYAPPYDWERNSPEYAASYKASWLHLFPLIFKKQHGLQFLQIKGDGSDDQDLDEPKETWMDLGDFFADMEWQMLQTFWLDDFKLLKPLTLTSIDCLCTTFPFLTSLSLRLHVSCRISFNHLAVLVDRLPQLGFLNIGVDGGSLADPPSVPVLSHRLAVLSVQRCTISDAYMFARYITRLFASVAIQELNHPTRAERLLMAAHKLVRECCEDERERSGKKSIRKKQTARRGRASLQIVTRQLGIPE